MAIRVAKYDDNMNIEQRLKAFGDVWSRFNGLETEGQVAFWENLLEAYGLFHTGMVQQNQRESNGGVSDVAIDGMKLLIEQKAPGVDLDAQELRQGTWKTPLRQCYDYARSRETSEHAMNVPEYLATCNYREIRFYSYDDARTVFSTIDNQQGVGIAEPSPMFTAKIDANMSSSSTDLDTIFKNPAIRGYVKSSTITDESAAKLFREFNIFISDKYYDEYLNKSNVPDSIKQEVPDSKARLLTGLMFALYASDAGFIETDVVEYLTDDNASMNAALISMFKAFSLSEDDPRRYTELTDRRAIQFPYIGDMFDGYDNILMPDLKRTDCKQILDKMKSFPWKNIDAVIFGSMMEGLFDGDIRRQNGIHWTPSNYIHRVINPLMIDELTDELDDFNENNVDMKPFEQAQWLINYVHDLGSYKVIDPACGSGNFIAETYSSMSHLENRALKLLKSLKLLYPALNINVNDIQSVFPSCYAGIEYMPYASIVAKMVMGIMETRMRNEQNTMLSGEHMEPVFPVHDGCRIITGNALRFDWNDLFDVNESNENNSHIRVIGNPPFVGQGHKNDEQKQDIALVMKDKINKYGYFDYCLGWYYKAVDYMMNAHDGAFSFVSTSGITGGIQVPAFKPLTDIGWEIGYAFKPFKWASNSKDANVSCVIIGMMKRNQNNKHVIYQENHDSNKKNDTGDVIDYIVYRKCQHVNAYLMDAPDVYLESRKKPLSAGWLPFVQMGVKPADNGWLILNETEYNMCSDYDKRHFIRKFMNGNDFMNGKLKYCIWIPSKNQPSNYNMMSDYLKTRIEKCKDWRSKQKHTSDSFKLKESPWKMRENREKKHDYFGFPQITNITDYYPLMKITNEYIMSNNIFICDDNIAFIMNHHIVLWEKMFCNMIGPAHIFSNTLILNTFPLPAFTDSIASRLNAAGQEVLDAQANHPDKTPAQLYRMEPMPVDLLTAHQAIDRLIDGIMLACVHGIHNNMNPFLPAYGLTSNNPIDDVMLDSELSTLDSIPSDDDRLDWMIEIYNEMLKWE